MLNDITKGTDRANPGAEAQPTNRRVVRRCPFVADAEVIDLSSGTRLSGRTSELGIGGCYVKAPDPFEKGALVQLRIFREQRLFETRAKVAYSHDAQLNSGIGLVFQDMAPCQRTVLESWLAEIVTQLRSGIAGAST